MALRISIDKSFPGSEENIKELVRDGSSDPNDVVFSKLFEDSKFKIIKVSRLRSDEEQGVLQEVIEHGYPARSIPE